MQTFVCNMSRHLEFIIEQGRRVNWVSGSLDSRVTGSHNVTEFHLCCCALHQHRRPDDAIRYIGGASSTCNQKLAQLSLVCRTEPTASSVSCRHSAQRQMTASWTGLSTAGRNNDYSRTGRVPRSQRLHRCASHCKRTSPHRLQQQTPQQQRQLSTDCTNAATNRFSFSWRTPKKGKGSPYSISERKVPELIPVRCSQPAGDVSHKPGGRLPLLSARPAVTLTTLKKAATNVAAW